MRERIMQSRFLGFSGARGLGSLAVIIITLAGGIALPCRGEAEALEHAFILTTDYYTAGYYSTIEIPPPRNTMVSIEPVSTDAVACYDVDEDVVFVINRGAASNIQIVDTDSAFSTIGQYSVGNGSNPHDIRLADGTKAYVSRFEWKTLLICHPYTGDSLGVIDLSPVADADGIPEMDRMEIVDKRLFVTLNSINHTTWQPDGPGKVAVIDVEADTLVDCNPDSAGVQPIVLSLENPYTELRYDPCSKDLYVGCLGRWGVEDGGIEIIDPETCCSEGVLLTESQLGGDVSDVVLAPGGGGYAVVLEAVAWPDNFARLVKFDGDSGAVTDTLYEQTSGMGSSLAGIELNSQMEVYLCDRDLSNPGIRIYDTATDAEVDFREVGLPPFDIAFTQVPFASLDYPIDGTPNPLAIGARPNPFISSTTIRLSAPGNRRPPTRLGIFDARGRRVATLPVTRGGSGVYSASWDGTDDHGREVGPGVYFCRWPGKAYPAAGRLVLVR